MIKVLVCDGDGTLQLPNPTDELRNLLGVLQNLGVQLAVASNSKYKTRVLENFKRAGLQEPAIIVTPNDVKALKPSPAFIEYIRQLTGVELMEIAYLGDDDYTDILCAINARVLPFAAKYSNSGKPTDYGLPIGSPKELAVYLSTYGMQKDPYFGWQCISSCSNTGTTIDVRALIGNHRSMGLTDTLKRFLKDKIYVNVGKHGVPFATILFHYLVSQTYLSGLMSQVDSIAVYPGHIAHSQNPILEGFSSDLRKAFRQRYTQELLIRHSDAQASHLMSGASRDIYEQFRTIMVNSSHAKKIQDKCILVLDDFTTSGSSLETARQMLLKAGARKVISIAIAKYRSDYSKSIISEDWDPYQPCTLRRQDIKVIQVPGMMNTISDEYFKHHIWPVYLG